MNNGMKNKFKMRKDVPIASGMLVAINVIVFVICTFTDNLLYNMGRLDVTSVLVRGEYGRVIWSMFLHSGINHIFNNMVVLFFLGSMIEKEIGHIRYAILYLLSGIGGGILSLFYKTLTFDMSGTVGASGAIFGLDGALLALILFSGRRMANVTPNRVILMIAYSLYSGFTGESTDNAAHIGGLITGFLIGLIICIIDRIKQNVKNERCSFEH